MPKRFALSNIAMLLILSVSCDPDRFFRSHDQVFSSKGLVKSATATDISPVLRTEIVSGRNALWCITFQLAWNELRGTMGGTLDLQGNPSLAVALNQGKASKHDLDRASYVAVGGRVRDRVFQNIQTAVTKTFRGKARPRLIPSAKGLRPQDVVAYAYLFKHLAFRIPFERMNEGMTFDGVRVACFGRAHGSAASRQMLDQVLIHAYSDPDHFVIELVTRATKDQLIFAKIDPEKTLAATVDAALAALNHSTPPPTMGFADELKIPKSNFDLSREYTELQGRRILSSASTTPPDLFVLMARQDIRFQMDEKGVRLKSEATIVGGCCAMPPPMGRSMIFDKPFLVLMKRKDSQAPYFALWVENAELLMKRK